MQEIWTIGHSTSAIESFLKILRSHQIDMLVDVRRYPGSRRYPQFNKDALAPVLAEYVIGYQHMEALGGRRTPAPDSPNTAWRMAQFRGYADHMATPEFQEAMNRLRGMAAEHRVAIMCSEAVWWRCHRSLIADLLKSEGWRVMNIMGVGKADEHPYTKAARIVEGRLSYAGMDGPSLFTQASNRHDGTPQ
jgi:uncharacterized protein (DUF488 family)